jgi:hypothetical protein
MNITRTTDLSNSGVVSDPAGKVRSWPRQGYGATASAREVAPSSPVGSRVRTVTFWLAPVLTLILVVAADVWVYLDARCFAAAGSPVFLRVGAFTIDTPVAWLVGCVVLWIFFFPMYLVSGSRH